MEITFRFFRNMMVASLIVTAGTIVLSSCKKDNNNNKSKTYALSGNASASQMVPPVTGNGTGTVNGTYDPNTRILIYTTNWTNLTGAPTSASFYNGATGTSGTVVGGEWNLGSGLAATGSFTDTLTLTADQGSQLTSGNWYYVFGTIANPTGEIRGQITATQQ
jgi:hypothetical protein